MSPFRPDAGHVVKRALAGYCVFLTLMTIISLTEPTWVVVLYTLVSAAVIISPPHQRWLKTGSPRKQLPRG